MDDVVSARSPIILASGPSPPSAAQLDGIDVDVPDTPEGEDFWEAWLAEIAEAEREAENSLDTQPDEWEAVGHLRDAPDQRYHLQAYDLGADYAAMLEEHWPKPATPMTEESSELERDLAQRWQRLHLKADADMVLLLQAVMAEPSELQLPTELAYLSKMVGEQALWEGSQVLV